MYTKSLRISRFRLLASQQKLARLSHLAPNSPLLIALSSLPPQITALFEAAAALPHMDGLGGALQMPVPDPSKRMWETGEVGYTNWAVQQMIMGWKGGKDKEEEEGKVEGASATLLSAEERTERVGSTEEVKLLLANLENPVERGGDRMDTT